ncbi:MAG: DUF3011 domain-containing protein [Stenotrophomonas sp.]
MSRSPLLLIAAIPLAWLSLATTANASIPLFNGSCPGGLEIHADDGGPVYVNGKETTLKRFNDNYYEARDSSSGVTLSISRSADGGTQVSYTGAGGRNGICSLDSAPAEAAPTRDKALPHEVTCESTGKAQAECDMDTHGDVRLVRQLSHTECVQNQNWGLYHHSVWVKDGCRAVFSNAGNGRSTQHAAGTGAGSELLGACNIRANAQGAVVVRVPVNDDVTELIIDYPDGRFLCMVRNDGLVESLTRMRAKR